MRDEATRPPGRPRFGTVRSRLTLLATTVVAAVLVVSGIWLVGVQRSLLTHGTDEALRQRTDNLGPDISRGALGTELPGQADREDSFLQLVDDRGTVVAASANVRGRAATVAPLPPGAEPMFRAVSDVPLSTHRFRVLASPVRSGSGGRMSSR